jgi:transcriptional regulator with XRE-family HTH domain
MTIGENIKRLRKAKGLTQQQLADEIGVERPYITAFERGSRIPNMSIGDAIAKELGCTLNELIDRPPPTPSQQSQFTIAAE